MVHHLETLDLVQLPCWEKLSAEDYQARVAVIVEGVEQEAAAKRALEGKSCLGPDRILQQDPLGAPKKSAMSPRPLFHAVSERARKAMREAFKAFIDAFFLASAEFREGNLDAVFPDGSYPPARPFFAGACAGPVIL